MILIPLGPPGCGKGTQAKRIASRLGLAHLSTGDMFRAAIKDGTEMGKQAKAFIDRGELVPDSVTIGLIADRLKAPDCQSGFILDGFPRTVAQAQALEELLKARGTPIDRVVEFQIPDQELVGRLSGRRTCSKCGAMYHLKAAPPKKPDTCDQCGTSPLTHRSDDHSDVIKNRLNVYHQQTAPLIDFYRKSGKLCTLNASLPPDQVEKQLEKFL